MSETSTNVLQELRDDFSFLTDWEDRYGHIIALGRALPALSDDEKTPEHRVDGCASQVWLILETEGDETCDKQAPLVVRGDSDALIVRGLAALLAKIYSGRTPHEALAIDAAALFSELGLSDHLTAQRANGLAHMVARVRAFAQARAGGGSPARQSGGAP